jgi:hypothetical protein
MKMISLRLFGTLVGLGVLWVIVPNARSDDATDWANQQAQAQKEREDWQNQQAQAAREAEQAQKERDLNEYFNQIWKSSEAMQKWADEQARARQEEINQGGWGPPAAAPPAAPPPKQQVVRPAADAAFPALPPPQPGAKEPKTYTMTIYNGSQVTRTTFVMGDDGSWHASEGLGFDSVTPAAPVAGPIPAPQVRFPAQAIPQQSAMPRDPVAFQQMVRQNQEQVRQQILQTRQQMLQRIRR